VATDTEVAHKVELIYTELVAKLTGRAAVDYPAGG
jgi:hypothetical protein